MHKFGELAVVTRTDKIQSKITNKGITAMYLGHADNHAGDVYRMLNLKTERVITTRDVRWLKTSYASWKKQQNDDNQEEPESENDSENEEYRAVKEENEINCKDDAEHKPTNQSNQKVVRELKIISGSWFNPDADRILDDIEKQRQNLEATLAIAEPSAESPKENANFAIEQLFSDFAFFVREELLQSNADFNKITMEDIKSRVNEAISTEQSNRHDEPKNLPRSMGSF
jgi:hypothetical protein